MPTKVFIYSHAFAPKVGGVETYVMLLARGLARLAEVTVATLTPAGKMNDSDCPFRIVRGPSLATLVKLIWHADVLHLAGPCFLPMLLGLTLRKKVVVEHHGYQAICPNGLLLFEPTKSVCPGHFMERRYDKCLRCNANSIGWVRSIVNLALTFPRRWACRLVAMNVPISSHVQNRMRLPRSRVIYYGIGDSQGLNGSGRESFEGAPVLAFAYAGRLVSEKGLDLLVEAASRLKQRGCNFRLKFIGDGPERSRLETAVNSFGLGEWVTFTGYLRGKDFENALMEVTALVMPSIWEETAGLSAIEHMMQGRLVIATDVGGLGEMVADAGLKFPLGDAEALTDCMKRVLDEPGLMKTLGQKARHRALQLFLEDRMVADHRAAYFELLARD